MCVSAKLFQILRYLLFQQGQVVGHNFPNHLRVNLKILMDNVVAHTVHHSPGCVRMGISKLLSEHMAGLTENFNVLDYGVIHHVVRKKILKRLAVRIARYAANGLLHMLKPAFISARLSRI